MNSLFNSALKQTQSLKRDLDVFSSSKVSSPALQGQISASLAALNRTIDDYDAMARRELIPAKKEKAEQRVQNFKKELSEYRAHFEKLKGDRQDSEMTTTRNDLLNRRGHSSATPENPYSGSTHARAPSFVPAPTIYASASTEDHHFRERNFLGQADTQLDEFLDRGRAVLQDLSDQREMLKNTQKKLYSVANTLGISGDTIRMIERRAKEDKYIFWGGVVIFFVFCYFVLRWFG
ncbi:synaptobrevin [Pyronema domesticum]|uniref:Protein transport protein BOS1 n=1 Tax=Pyronema omphalodes (strain CBS 100304) TaxID=1076935 RepID=U4LDP2_PYROM|nr:synaptobrevin [Pyronema domesticum]CCX08989.1 Similar to Protein transport protein bos1; acc. no. Q9P7G5 [Pyronema omphalodes CBS 100304]